MRTLLLFLTLIPATSFADELHVVGLYRPQSALFGQFQKDIRDWPGLCTKLAKDGPLEAPSPARQVWKLLPAEIQKLVRDPGRVRFLTQGTITRTEEGERRRLGRAFEDVLKSDTLYDLEAFQGVKLSEQAEQLVQRREGLTRLERRWMNRLLLEAAFPKEIPHKSDDIPEIVTVKVTVRGKPLTLALTAYESIRWKVETAEGVKLEKIIVSGHRFQEIMGAGKSSVTNITAEDAPADQKEPQHFYAWSDDTGDFDTLQTRLADLTGLKIATFQGQNAYTGEPIVVDGRKGAR